jgi:deazaflavin-dependent oxidoreductase (nitroreductase family)
MQVSTKRKLVVGFARYVLNPIARPIANLVGLTVLETIGRTTGKRRRTPLGAFKKGGAFWIVSEHGRHANYVKNIVANPRVRLKYRFRWHEGTAHLLDDVDPRPYEKGLNGRVVRALGTAQLVVRIDPDQG